MTTVAVLPVKRLGEAKQRLDETLAGAGRRALAEAMAGDVLDALTRAAAIHAIVVVTGEPMAERLAAAAGAATVADPDDAGHVPAARLGVAWALGQGATRALLVPGDCPTLDPAEVDELLAGAEAGVVVVPDRHGTGTNALVLAPPDVIAPSFGPGSRARHEAAARAAGAAVRVAEPPSLVLDVDTADDLAALRAALDRRPGGAARTRAALTGLAP
jgi:2-phospho-L-lactate guanylyltransferase